MGSLGLRRGAPTESFGLQTVWCAAWRVPAGERRLLPTWAHAIIEWTGGAPSSPWEGVSFLWREVLKGAQPRQTKQLAIEVV